MSRFLQKQMWSRGPWHSYLCWMGKCYLTLTQSYYLSKGAKMALGQQSKCPGARPCVEEMALVV